MIRTTRIFAMGMLGIALSAGACAAQSQAPSSAPASYRLTLREAIERGLQHNVRVRLGEARIRETEGTVERRRANLLPRARFESYANLQNRNLRAFGISFPGAPDVVGPFSNFDFRLSGEQPLLDLQSYRAWKATERQQAAAREDLQDSRDTVVRQVAALYLSAQAAAARARAAQSRVTTAEELDRLARERRAAGVATGVDVLRAQVELANAKQRLLEAQNATRQNLLVLARTIGISPGAALELAEPLAFQLVAAPDVAAALSGATQSRADYRSLLAQREALALQLRATRARYLPRFSIGGNYGGLGRSVGSVRGTGVLQATLSVSVFDRDREGEQSEIESRLDRLDYLMADLRLGIEQDIREALLALDSAAEEVNVAREGHALAERELALARERFQAGVTNNVEVVNAQAALERAQENVILAIVRHGDARMALARALGATEANYARYLSPQ